MSHIRQKFQNGTIVHFADSPPAPGFSMFGRWTVVVGKPDCQGLIVVVNQFDEYSLVRQADMKEAE